MAAHAGFESAAGARFARVQRIAVHPALQRRGLGGRLLRRVIEDAAGRGLDFLGAGFGAGAGLLRFWRRAGLATVRVGVRRDAASGAHSAVMLRALRPEAEALLDALRSRFHEQLADWLIEPLDDLDPELVLTLLGERPAVGPSPGPMDCADLAAFAHGRRDFAAAAPALRRLAWSALAAAAEGLEPIDRDLLVMRVLQRRREADVASALGLAGRSELLDHLRAACRRLLALSGHCQ